MEQNALKNKMWNAAGTAGLALGAVSAAYLFATQMISGSLEPATAGQMVISTLLWIAKFGGCIWLMNFFMKKYAEDNKLTDSKSVFRMGMATALLSALMFSAIYLANMLYISPEFYDEVFQTAIQQMRSQLDSNRSHSSTTLAIASFTEQCSRQSFHATSLQRIRLRITTQMNSKQLWIFQL